MKKHKDYIKILHFQTDNRYCWQYNIDTRRFTINLEPTKAINRKLMGLCGLQIIILFVLVCFPEPRADESFRRQIDNFPRLTTTRNKKWGVEHYYIFRTLFAPYCTESLCQIKDDLRQRFAFFYVTVFERKAMFLFPSSTYRYIYNLIIALQYDIQ